MKAKGVILGLVLALAGVTGFGREVQLADAKQAGLNFYFERINQFLPTPASGIRIIETLTQKSDGRIVYYIFNMEPAGYIAVSAEDAVTPVLAYSFTGSCSLANAPSQFTAWMKQYEAQIAGAIAKNLKASEPVEKAWNRYLVPTAAFEAARRVPLPGKPALGNAVAPLIISNWDQPMPYNEQCPPDPAGPGGHTLVGCVPVCMGQIMYYYRWPLKGTGSYSYHDSIYGTLSADFGNTAYDWDNMTNTSTISNPGIAKLLYHLGVSCDLVYGPAASGMYNHKAAYALRTFFRYSPETRYVFRDSTTMNWDSILIAHLDRKMPLYYAGWSDPNISGHAFVCDGYQDTAYFHFNFGWSGQNNGYFYTDNLTPGGNNFKLAQEVIINAYPDTLNYTYPVYCTGSKHLTTLSGSLTDGSGPISNYTPDSDCSWLIDPQPAGDSVSSVTLTFNNINTGPTDKVTIYDGGTEAAPVIGNFSGDTIPPAITGTTNKMLVKFKGSNGAGAPGWFATYKSKIPVWCSGTNTITGDTAVITDGSYGFNYHNNSVCRWILQSGKSTPLTIHFRRFDTEAGKDILSVYDLGNNTKLKEISGHYDAGNLPDSVTAPGGKMMLIFMTNSSVTAAGWEIYYPLSHVGIDSEGPVRDLQIYPNPASGKLYVGYRPGNTAALTFRVSDITGNTISVVTAAIHSADHEQIIDISNLRPGIYLLQIGSDAAVVIRKFVVR